MAATPERITPEDERPVAGEAAPPSPELAEALAGLTPPEQEALAQILRRASSLRKRAGELDLVGFLHAPMRADFETALTKDYDELSRMAAPPVLKRYPDAPLFDLPAPEVELPHTLGEVIRARASRRDYGGHPLEPAALATLLHHAYGVRKQTMAYNVNRFPVRFVPSAGGLQSCELYLVANDVEGLPQGLYHYAAQEHGLEQLEEGNLRRRLVGLSFLQEWLHHASAVIIITSVMERVEWKYGPRGYRMIHVDVGILAQSLHLLATALKLRSTMVSGFFDELLDVDGRAELATLMVALGSRPSASPAVPSG